MRNPALSQLDREWAGCKMEILAKKNKKKKDQHPEATEELVQACREDHNPSIILAILTQ